jgi:outer membrane protein TolC
MTTAPRTAPTPELRSILVPPDSSNVTASKRTAICLCLAISAAGAGCGARDGGVGTRARGPAAAFTPSQLQIDYPDVAGPASIDLSATPPPMSLVRSEPTAYRDLSLDEAVQTALANNRLLRDLGGQLLRSPQNSATIYDPALVETDPRFGVEAALSAFDASYAGSAIFEKNDRALNNQFFGGGTRLLQQDLYVFQNQLTKRTAAGTQLTLRHYTDYDGNNAPGNAFPSAWNSNFETEFRQPWLQGGGLDFNRIAGPGAVPGNYNGVLIARVNTDVSLAELEAGVRNLLSDVENAYWDLYFAYRDLDAKVAARNAALETWRRIHSLYETGREGGEAWKEAYSREQYFRFEEEVQNALAGIPLDGTRTNNGTSGGTFRGLGGVQVCERRLRLLMGLPSTDGELLRPRDEPHPAPLTYDWQEMIAESLASRVELRRQRWTLKRRELELIASRNYLLPQLDSIGRYRWRGFGDDLVGGPGGRFSSAWSTLLGGDFQEWQMGVEMSMPLGFRRAHAAVRHAELQVARERSMLREMERQVVHDLGTAAAEIDRAFVVVQTAYNRRLAAGAQVQSAQSAFDADKATLDFVLESQRLLADASVRHERALAEYAVAAKNVEFEKGSLLPSLGVHMAESPWVDRAYLDARRNARSLSTGALNYVMAPARSVEQ